MGISRRQFLKNAAISGAGLALPFTWDVRSAFPFAQTPPLRKFLPQSALPGLGPAGKNLTGQYIPLATKHSITFAGKKTDLYDVVVAKFSEKMHPDLPNKTRFFGYTDLFTFDQKYLAGVIVATKGTPVLLTVTNLLPNNHILPVDPTIMAGPNGLTVGMLPVNRIATHLHGGLTPWFSDGTPFQWFTPFGQHGPSFKNVPGTLNIPGTGTYYYPNNQSARMVWYHDHAIGVTRLNAYAGIASAYIITDDFEDYLVNKVKLLPALVGVPLVVQDKTFWDPISDPNYKKKAVPGAQPGDLWYPWEYEANILAGGVNNLKGRWDYGLTVSPPSTGIMTPLPTISAVPEFFADTAMVNGTPYPVLNVTQGTFRFRILNASQARFWHLSLYQENPSGSGDVVPAPAIGNKPDLSQAIPGPAMYQIATEGGFLPAVAIHDNKTPLPLIDPDTANPDGPFNLLLAPAERADILIDFTGLNGKSFILYSDTPGPFPGGDPRNDYYTGNPDFTAAGPSPTNPYPLSGGAPTTKAGYGPNTRTIMKIVVGSGDNGFRIDPINSTWLADINKALKANFGLGPKLDPSQPAPQQDPPLDPSGLTPFNKTLNENFDEFGRLIQQGGTDTTITLNNQGQTTFGTGYLDPVTEMPAPKEVQVWDVYNTTGDTHPWHFHLVNVQVVGRGIFATTIDGTGATVPVFDSSVALTDPDPNEKGWKETVRMNPGEVTRVIMQFNLPVLPKVMGDPGSTRFGNQYPGKIVHEYVHHCHILEHEEHDMMRPLLVLENK
jgi:spore coat protein A